jgi:hypothetical protein
MPVYGVIAMAPYISQQAMLAQMQTIKTARALLVLPSDDEAQPGVDQAPGVSQALSASGAAYMMIDHQVHGHWGGYTADFLPYAGCSTHFFSPRFTPRRGEFQCYRDEMVPMLALFGLPLRGATAVWIGYLDKTGQSVAVVEHRTAAGSTVDVAVGGGLTATSWPSGSRRMTR